ncbi:ExbD/TolR family protein [Halocola ammonii]
MAKFKNKEKKEVGAVSTASLPDIVFMLLFFFMVVTVMREQELKVKIERPYASELTRLEKKHLVDYINIGPPMNPEVYGSEPRMQLDDDFATVEDIPAWIEQNREKVLEQEVPKMTTSLKVDEGTKMGIISAVKQKLRESNALKINYSTRKRDRTE